MKFINIGALVLALATLTNCAPTGSSNSAPSASEPVQVPVAEGHLAASLSTTPPPAPTPAPPATTNPLNVRCIFRPILMDSPTHDEAISVGNLQIAKNADGKLMATGVLRTPELESIDDIRINFPIRFSFATDREETVDNAGNKAMVRYYIYGGYVELAQSLSLNIRLEAKKSGLSDMRIKLKKYNMRNGIAISSSQIAAAKGATVCAGL